ncbi:MAG TPA: N-acetylmuramoyl-L-alanine amidase [Oscillatoriales cyanobacterium M4454_W2019_049]|nr:N-acetylmuramoyl-L-alanine amidase [Oscillatoriales cyanobacterium M4454_W2019_049]
MVKLFGVLPSVASLWMLSSAAAIAVPMPSGDAPTPTRTIESRTETGWMSLWTPNSPDLALAPQVAEASRSPVAQADDRIATVESIELAADGNQVLIRVDQPITYSSGWESALFYTITLEGARLDSGVSAPAICASTTISRIQVEQAGPETVVIRVQPRPQVQVQEVNQPSPQMLALYLQSYSASEPRIPALDAREGDSKLPRPNRENGQILVVLDPGHGGNDPGAVGIGGLNEVVIVDPIADRVAELLEANGVSAVLTRTEDIEVDLPPRVDLANRLDANLFVSIHANAIDMSRPDVNGIETYYFNEGKNLADIIHASLIDATGGPDRGVRTARFYVLRNTDMPAVLIEVGFVTGDYDAARLRDPDYRDLLAQAIARGILQYIERYCPGPMCQP